MNYLINEPPLVLLPSLATAIGLNEALVLQQIQYWISRSSKEFDGRQWIYNTYEAWVEQFPFWSKPTIVRTITNLEKMGVVLTANYNKAKFDKTKWYAIDYDRLREIIETTDFIKMSKRCYQNDKTMLSDCIDGTNQNDKTMLSDCIDGTNQNDNTYTRYYTDITTDIKQIDNSLLLQDTLNNMSNKGEKSQKVVADNIYNFYQQNFGVLNPLIGEKLSEWVKDLGEELVKEALTKTLMNGSRSFSYAETIMREWYNKNIKTLEQVYAIESEYQRRRNQFPASTPIKSESTPRFGSVRRG